MISEECFWVYVALDVYFAKKLGAPRFKKAPTFTARDIPKIRKKYGWTQSEFASALNVPRSTVASWEGGTKRPSGAAMRLLEIFWKSQPTRIPKPPGDFQKQKANEMLAMWGFECRVSDRVEVNKKRPR